MRAMFIIGSAKDRGMGDGNGQGVDHQADGRGDAVGPGIVDAIRWTSAAREESIPPAHPCDSARHFTTAVARNNTTKILLCDDTPHLYYSC